MQDFVTGFEGEPEIHFFRDKVLALRIWEGHLAAILEDVEPIAGLWTGLAKGWHLDQWSDAVWKAPISDCVAELQSLSVDSKHTAAVLDALRRLFQDAQESGAEVTVLRL